MDTGSHWLTLLIYKADLKNPKLFDLYFTFFQDKMFFFFLNYE